MKLDILVIVAHPDDAELSCSGTLVKAIQQGKKVGIVDLTKGEMGTRGTPELRMEEAEKASKIMGLSVRENLGFADFYFKNDAEHQKEVSRIIRKYQPDIIITNAVEDRHPDHGKGARLVIDSCFMSGLRKVVTIENGKEQEPWRPKNVFHVIQSNYLTPDFVVDVTEQWDVKVEAIKAFASQFFVGDADAAPGEPQTFISTPQFMQFLEARAREYGQRVGAQFAEGFMKSAPIKVNDLFDLV
ncbi:MULTISPECIES: bacillithiol biosynthesis deacetylase BshB1 [Flammeovirga]|uniref:Bacillithiol biosynthesis deacetylase BshB1 n=1 Tax=Flammeovirga agarivorans TaxID=2726742 RepID=A0A7X8SGP4_9BACT|nr:MULTISPECIES: bacillithiol biosynthesis deacetylase BshB1 [Flammeovirga]NLR89886.1 bacillithiol biosynthesis deacetylase BshB1 [Flammeovirga agarivorans]